MGVKWVNAFNKKHLFKLFSQTFNVNFKENCLKTNTHYAFAEVDTFSLKTPMEVILLSNVSDLFFR